MMKMMMSQTRLYLIVYWFVSSLVFFILVDRVDTFLQLYFVPTVRLKHTVPGVPSHLGWVVGEL